MLCKRVRLFFWALTPITKKFFSRFHVDSSACVFQVGPVGFDMNILCHVMYLLLLGVISCQNNRNAKPSGKGTKKPNSQAIETSQHGPEDDPNPGPAGAAESSKDTNAGGRGVAQQSSSPNKPTDEMKLYFLKNTLVTCNDGTAAG